MKRSELSPENKRLVAAFDIGVISERQRKPRVLIEVSGGCVSIYVDGEVDIRAGDFDTDSIVIGTKISTTPDGTYFFPVTPFEEWDEDLWEAQDPEKTTSAIVAMPEEE